MRGTTEAGGVLAGDVDDDIELRGDGRTIVFGRNVLVFANGCQHPILNFLIDQAGDDARVNHFAVNADGELDYKILFEAGRKIVDGNLGGSALGLQGNRVDIVGHDAKGGADFEILNQGGGSFFGFGTDDLEGVAVAVDRGFSFGRLRLGPMRASRKNAWPIRSGLRRVERQEITTGNSLRGVNSLGHDDRPEMLIKEDNQRKNGKVGEG